MSTAEACSFASPGGCVRKVAEAVVVVATAPATVAVDVVAGKELGQTARDVFKTGEKAVEDTGKTVEKAGKDTIAEVGRAGENVSEAVRATGKYAEAKLRGYKDIVSSTERRLREGKIADALWHASVDQWKVEEQAASAAVQESTLINAAASTAAGVYGGPGGAAAYASWYTYRASGGNAEAAIRAGILAGATAAGMGKVGKLPADQASQIAGKAILAGSIGGLAVAAAGGDEQAVLDGFLKGGGMVLVQDGYRAVVGADLDARASQGEPYCMATIGAECSPNLEAYELDANGNIVLQEDGTPKVDVRKTDLRRPHVGTWASAKNSSAISEASPGMIAVSKIPGMNAMSVFHDHWSVAWNMDAFTNVATIAPAVVLTYTGTGAPLYSEIEQAAIDRARGDAAKPPSA